MNLDKFPGILMVCYEYSVDMMGDIGESIPFDWGEAESHG